MSVEPTSPLVFRKNGKIGCMAVWEVVPEMVPTGVAWLLED